MVLLAADGFFPALVAAAVSINFLQNWLIAGSSADASTAFAVSDWHETLPQAAAFPAAKPF